MALIPGICTQCGATLTADDTKDCMICPYCNTPFIVEKAINNFHNTYNISNSTVNIYSKKMMILLFVLGFQRNIMDQKPR